VVPTAPPPAPAPVAPAPAAPARGELAFTGTNSALAIIGALMVLAGAGLSLVARRRRPAY
jgi:LPXTG-motif cell wall-anchored protein